MEMYAATVGKSREVDDSAFQVEQSPRISPSQYSKQLGAIYSRNAFGLNYGVCTHKSSIPKSLSLPDLRGTVALTNWMNKLFSTTSTMPADLEAITLRDCTLSSLQGDYKLAEWLSQTLLLAESTSNHFLNESQSIVAPQPPLPTTLPPKPRLAGLAAQVSHHIQVFSVSIHPDTGSYCEIYGRIQVLDDETVFNIFERGKDDPEAGGNLTLIDQSSDEPRNFICCRNGPVSLYLVLADRVSNSIVMDNVEVPLHAEDDDIEESCDKLLMTSADGRSGFACVYYAKFLHAVVATVMVEIFSNDPKDDNDLSVYGIVDATYGDARQFCETDDQVQNLKTVLFDKPRQQPVRVKIGSWISLTRSIVSVPAYSSLVINADFRDSNGQVVARGSAEFLAEVPRHIDQDILGEHYGIKIQVRWGLGHRAEEADLEFSEYTNAYKTFSECSPETFDSLRSKGILFGRTLGEVCSLYISGINRPVSSVCGHISVDDYDVPKWNLFERSRENPHNLTKDKMIATLEGPDVINCNRLRIDMHLEDPVNDFEISKGCVKWYDDGSGRCNDRALCAMVHGSDGYAVMHYIVFLDACEAQVEMSFYVIKASTMDPVNICGSVLGSCSNFNYSSAYLKKYFKSRLFDKPEAEPVQLTSNSEFPLLKRVMPVSTFGSLVIEVKLTGMSMDNKITDILNGKEQFEIDFAKPIRRKVEGEHYGVELCVNFSP